MAAVSAVLTVLAGVGSFLLIASAVRARTRHGRRVAYPYSLVERAAAAAAAPGELTQVLDRIVALMAREGLRGASVALIDGRDRLRIVAHRGRLSRSVRHSSLPLGEGVMGRVAAEDRPILVDDLDRPGAVAPAQRRLGTNAEIRSIAAVPIRMDGAVIGVLEVDSSRPARFDERDLNVLAQVALTICWVVRQAGRERPVPSSARVAPA